ncbi:unnamed protein product [Pieris macdunnoughi]|uniref:Uncharacterized protein n=1 Tax=Pieris macdunnoughi TaxID=345717 RepID=A0A821UJ27_9NEOP|nr:unnamed protein product [Pieris macdunnoughi]
MSQLYVMMSLKLHPPQFDTELSKLVSRNPLCSELVLALNESSSFRNCTSSEIPTSGGLWSICENIIKAAEEDEPLSTLSCNDLKEEVEKYLWSPNISRDADPFVFWHNDILYPNLKKLAQK